MSKWEMVRLGDVCEVSAGQGAPQNTKDYSDEGIPFIRAGHLSDLLNGILTENDLLKINETIAKKHKLKLYPQETILFAKSGMSCMKGYIYILRDSCYVVNHLACLIPKSINPNFLNYTLLKHPPNSLIKDEAYPSISLTDISEFKIPLPPLPIQQKIANVLDRANVLIEKRKEQIAKLDLLVKSRFVEMFGDPVRNPMGWEVKKVIDECECMVPGRDKPKSFTGDIPWITIDDLVVNGITTTSKKEMGLTKAEVSEVKRKPVPTGSVLMSCVGNLGICSIAGKELIINQQLHSFQCGDRINNYYLMYHLGYRVDYMNQQATSTTVLYMNKSVCNSIPIILPPLDLQTRFADFVRAVEKSKSEIIQGLEKLELLYNSLIQKCFKGEI